MYTLSLMRWLAASGVVHETLREARDWLGDCLSGCLSQEAEMMDPGLKPWLFSREVMCVGRDGSKGLSQGMNLHTKLKCLGLGAADSPRSRERSLLAGAAL